MRLNMIPQIVIRKLQHTREELEQASVHRSSQVLAESPDFVKERVEAFGSAFNAVPVGTVPIELLNAVRHGPVALAQPHHQHEERAQSDCD